ncbi:DUF1122 family protein [Thermoproteus tenax]|uniref:DUF1122 domain-containing protein n=1 Tax=Thermoproteus tenax (strain ATCC 35583 / DSM 2078 / JCM 9277 / NBRC 100435 / Kra 1) TaxID=768679 RepID=G4RNE8_THETK|nr:DUF1122 family protein [Thermoproteus tenax]CCC81092.1 conserved hypothetical protein [Thermoproteus tenax Kra 1]
MLSDLLSDRRFVIKSKRGRLAEEIYLEIWRGGRLVAHAVLFLGRPPYYSPWAELFNIKVLNTDLERELYCLFGRYMEKGDLLYVEYVDDRQTYAELQRGTPPEETRLGRLLSQCGFRVLRDMYFPEGGLEGSVKLQAIKT